VEEISGYYKFTDDFPSVADIEKWVAGHPDADQLTEIISRSYDYIRKLPLKGISERYFDDELSLKDATE
jgi:hypothetical protein